MKTIIKKIGTIGLILLISLVELGSVLLVSPKAVEATNTTRVTKTVEYVLGGGTDSSYRVTGNTVYAGSSWHTTKGSAGTQNIILNGNNIDVRNAYLELRFMSTSPGASDVTDIDMSIDTNPGPSAGVDVRVSPWIQNVNALIDNSGVSQNVMIRADVSGQFEEVSDAAWDTGVATVASFSQTAASWINASMRLVITYSADYPTSATDMVNTVRFPLKSTNGSDTGTRTSTCTAGSTCSFTYHANIPELASNSDILDVWFEIRGETDSNVASSTITAQINGGSSGTAQIITDSVADNIDFLVIQKPSVGGSNFSTSTVQTLDILNSSSPSNTIWNLGGEVVVTYRYSTGAPTQTETVKYFMKQETAKPSTSTQNFSQDVHIANTGRDVREAWLKMHTAKIAAANYTVNGAIGASATTSNQVFTLPGTNNRTGESVMYFSFNSATSSFSSATTTLSASNTYSSASADQESAVEAYLTFHWSGSSGGAQTKTTEFFGGNSGGSTIVATEYHNFPITVFTPETVSKVHNSSYIETQVIHSEATTIALGTFTMAVNGTSTVAVTEDGDTEGFTRTYFQQIPWYGFVEDDSSQTFNFLRRSFNIRRTFSAADEYNFSNKVVVTYTANFAENPPTPSNRITKTVEYVLGGGTDPTGRSSGNLVYAGSSWNTTKGSAGTKTIILNGENIDVRNAFLEARFAPTGSSADTTDVDMLIDTTPGPAPATDVRVSPVLQAGIAIDNSGVNQPMMVRADVTGQFEEVSDAEWDTGVSVVAGISQTASTWNQISMKLVITYGADYPISATDMVNTVRFPLKSTNGSDTGTRTSTCTAGSTCSFSYTANIPEIETTADILDVWFEIRGETDSNVTGSTITPTITGGTTGTAQIISDAVADNVDFMVYYQPPVGGSDFATGTVQTLDVVNSSSPANTLSSLGGELVVTYRYSTDAPIQTETVKYFMKQETAKPSTNAQYFRKDIHIANTGRDVREAWLKMRTPKIAAANYTVAGKIGSSATTSNQVFALPGTNNRAGESVIYFSFNSATSSFSGATTTIAATNTFSSSSADQESAVEAYLTFNWAGYYGGPQTKTTEFFVGHSPATSNAATEYHNFPVTVYTPETVTKVHNSSYIETQVIHSEATTIAVGTATLAINGTSTVAVTEDGDTEGFTRTLFQELPWYGFTGSATSQTFDFTNRSFNVRRTHSAADEYNFSNKMVVTYTAYFTDNEVISFNSASSANWLGAGNSSISWSHTTQTGSSKILIVGVAIRGHDQDNEAVTGITYNGTPLSHATDTGYGQVGGIFRDEIWYLVDPPVGTYTIAVTLGGSVDGGLGAGAISLNGVSQSSPIGATSFSDEQTATGASVTTDITTTTVNSWLVDLVHGRNDADIDVKDGNQINRVERTDGVNHILGMSTKVTTTAGSYDMGWINGDPARYWDHIVVEVRPSVTVVVPVLDQIHYRWINDDGPLSSASYFKAEDTSVESGDGLVVGERKRLRFVINNTGGSATDYTYLLEHSSSSCSTWLPVPTTVTGNTHWVMDLSTYAQSGVATTDDSGLTNPGGSSFSSGYFVSESNQTSAHTLSGSSFTEHEYSLRSTVNSETGLTYCFRLTNAGSTTNFTYTAQPQAVLAVRFNTGSGGGGGGMNGSGSLEGEGSGSEQGGGGEGGNGGNGEEGGGSGSGGGDDGGGGGGDLGFIWPEIRLFSGRSLWILVTNNLGVGFTVHSSYNSY